MSTVAEIARVMRLEVGQVLGLCEQAGLAKQGGDDELSEADKQALLHIIRSGGSPGAKLVRSQASLRQVEIPRSGSPGFGCRRCGSLSARVQRGATAADRHCPRFGGSSGVGDLR